MLHFIISFHSFTICCPPASPTRCLGTERAGLGTFRGFGTERARLGSFSGFGTGLRASRASHAPNHRASRAVRHFLNNLKKVSFFYLNRASSSSKTEVLPEKKSIFFTKKKLSATQKTEILHGKLTKN